MVGSSTLTSLGRPTPAGMAQGKRGRAGVWVGGGAKRVAPVEVVEQQVVFKRERGCRGMWTEHMKRYALPSGRRCAGGRREGGGRVRGEGAGAGAGASCGPAVALQ